MRFITPTYSPSTSSVPGSISTIPTISSGPGYLLRETSSAPFKQLTLYNLIQDGYWVKATGSRVTKSGWTSESDWDYVVYDPDNTLSKQLEEDTSWSVGDSGNGIPGIDFRSYKNGDLNLILTDNENVWKKYIIATNLIKTLDCETKGERIKVFDSVFEKDSNLKAVSF